MSSVRARLDALRAQMDAEGVDLVAIGPTANMRYLLGFAPHADERLCLLLVTAQTAHIVVPSLNADQVAGHTDLPLQRWADEQGPDGALARALGGAGGFGRLAVDNAMRADFLLPLLVAAQPGSLVPADQLVSPLRERKSAEELEMMARAAAQADRAMQAGVDACRPGATEAGVAWAVETAFRQDGAEAVDFAIIAAGPHGAFPHHHPGQTQLRPGDAVILDIGATLGGYKSDITRVVHLGPPGDEFRRVYAAVLAANEAGRAAVRPGVTAREVDGAARSAIEAAGYGPYFTHRTGHGLGLEVHEPPYITAVSDEPLDEGMVFSVEPGIYLAGRFGVRIEDIVAVTPDGSRLLTGFDHALVVKE